MVGLLPAGVAVSWADPVEEDLRRVAEESDGELSVESLRASLASGAAQLWIVHGSGQYVGLVVEERNRRWLNLVAVRLRYNGGALETVLRCFGQQAAESGLGLCCSSRRPGMGRLLARYGWRPRFVEYVAGSQDSDLGRKRSHRAARRRRARGA